MRLIIIDLDKNSSEQDVNRCAKLLLKQMSFINSSSTLDKVQQGLRDAIDLPATTLDNESGIEL